MPTCIFKRLCRPLIMLLLLAVCRPGTAGAEISPEALHKEVSAAAAILMDRESRRILWQINPHEQRAVASTTKILTALVALEIGDEEAVVRVSRKAAETGGSSIWLEAGEMKTLSELLYGLILHSGNDAAVAIAESLAGSVAAFCDLMNYRARSLGARHTHFCNPHGLPDDGHYSTAYDLALIACHALEIPRFREIASTPEYSISWPGKEWNRLLVNQNRLLELYAGGDGVKTGWTEKAGRCFVGSATRDGRQLVTVVLNAPRMWEDSMALLDYGFTAYRREKLAAGGSFLGEIPVSKGFVQTAEACVAEDFYYPLLPGEQERVRYVTIVEPVLKAPVLAGAQVGWMKVFLEEQQIGQVALVAGAAVPRLTYWQHFARMCQALLRVR